MFLLRRFFWYVLHIVDEVISAETFKLMKMCFKLCEMYYSDFLWNCRHLATSSLIAFMCEQMLAKTCLVVVPFIHAKDEAKPQAL